MATLQVDHGAWMHQNLDDTNIEIFKVASDNINLYAHLMGDVKYICGSQEKLIVWHYNRITNLHQSHVCVLVTTLLGGTEGFYK